MNVLLVLPPCLFTWSERFSIELFGVQNNSTKTDFNASRIYTVTCIPLRERELVSLSLSLGFTQITGNNEHQ